MNGGVTETRIELIKIFLSDLEMGSIINIEYFVDDSLVSNIATEDDVIFDSICPDCKDDITPETKINCIRSYDGSKVIVAVKNILKIYRAKKTKNKIDLLKETDEFRFKPGFSRILKLENPVKIIFNPNTTKERSFWALYTEFNKNNNSIEFAIVQEQGTVNIVSVNVTQLINEDIIFTVPCVMNNEIINRTVPSSMLVEKEKMWNYDKLITGRPYRLEKSGEVYYALLVEINDSYLRFVTATLDTENPDISNRYIEILVRPGLESTDYDVYPME